MIVGVRTARVRRAVVCAGLVAALPVAGLRASERAPEAVISADPAVADGAPASAAARRHIAGPPAPLQRSAIRSSEPDRVRGWRTDATLVTAGQLADVISTEIALSRPGAREANPLVANRAVRIPAKLAIAGGISLGCYELRKHNRHGTARALSVASFFVGAAAAVHNMTVAR